jgi:PAS domain S-box-containing protein
MNMMRIGNQNIITDDIFAIVIENFPDMIHSVDENGQIVYANAMAESLLGYTRDELRQMNINDLYAEEIREQLEQGFSALKESGEQAVESILKDREGKSIPVEIRSFSIYDNDGNFVRTFSILRDIRKVKDLQQRLVHSARLAGIGELASGIVHDINNPLSVITMCGEMMTDILKHPERLGERECEGLQSFAVDVGRAADSIHKLVTHLRNYSRGVQEGAEPLDLHGSLQDALFLVGSKIQKAKVTVDVEVEKGRYMIHGNANQVEQVLSNLVSNACDAMEGQDRPQLTIRAAPCVRDSAAFWKVSFSDTGPGIPRELQQEIFHSFFTTKQKGKGTGLGLSIARGIVKDHGGDIELVSEPGSGSTFSVYFRQADAESGSLNGSAYGTSLLAG